METCGARTGGARRRGAGAHHGGVAGCIRSSVLPMERAHCTRRKYATHRLTVLTWAVWKGVLKDLLPMSTDALQAFIWDALAFEPTISVLKHCVNAIKAWHRRLGMPVPADGPGLPSPGHQPGALPRDSEKDDLSASRPRRAEAPASTSTGPRCVQRSLRWVPRLPPLPAHVERLPALPAWGGRYPHLLLLRRGRGVASLLSVGGLRLGGWVPALGRGSLP
jgi:hypothetical protein